MAHLPAARGSFRLIALGAILLSAAGAQAGCGGSDKPTLTVFAASSLSEALGNYGESFRGARVRASFAGSDQLAAQIRQGAGADVFVSADSGYPAELHREGLVGEPVVFARNRLVAVVPADSPVRSLEDLTRPGMKVVIGDRSVPVGAYTREMLDRLPASEREGILAAVRSEEPEVSSVLAKVVDGGADAGFVYATDARTVGGKVRTLGLPRPLQPKIAYAAAVVGDSAQPELARRYLRGLLHGRGAAGLREAGFLPPR